MAFDPHGSSQNLFSAIKTRWIVNAERAACEMKARNPILEGANPADIPVEFPERPWADHQPPDREGPWRGSSRPLARADEV